MSPTAPPQQPQPPASPELIESSYFTSEPPPAHLPDHQRLTAAFIDHHLASGRRVALVTSGGTTVPLENQTVRFIDNFSAGTRGATSAEYFLEAGYAVIFLHRQFSLLPYSRHYSHSTNCFLDFMQEDDRGRVVVGDEYQGHMKTVLRQYQQAKRDRLLLLLPFTTVTEYLWELRAIAREMRRLDARGLFYLAAAVSDFFVPKNRMVEHKIQSSNELESQAQNRPADGSDAAVLPAAHTEGAKLVVDLDPVPKFLKRLVEGWAPQGMIVSFKLETDPSILIKKAEQALNRYSHHLVIGNLLSTRKWEVVFVMPHAEHKWIRVPRSQRNKSLHGNELEVGRTEGSSEETVASSISGKPMEIEALIVPEIEKMHTELIDKSQHNDRIGMNAMRGG